MRLNYSWDEQNGRLNILEENHYYPYGMKHTNYNSAVNDYVLHEETGMPLYAVLNPVDRSKYQYKYNGKEYQDELGLNLYDMDFRDYDPAIARWTGIDPVIHYSQSTYNGFDSNPVFWADPSGASVIETKDAFTFTGNDAGNFFEALKTAMGGEDGIFIFNQSDYIDLTRGLDGEGGGGGKGGVGNPPSSKYPWDLNGDKKLSKNEADLWFLYGKGVAITVDNAYIDWTGLTMSNDVDFGGSFAIQTHSAFIKLRLETAATFGGTSFIRTGWLTAEVQSQLYHYELRKNDSMKNIIRNIMNEAGKPGQQNYTREGSPPLTGTPFMINYVNPTIQFTLR